MNNTKLKKEIMTILTTFMAVGLMMCIQKQPVMGASAAASSNAYLKSLSVNPGTLTPEFSSEVTNYTVSVEEDVERISVTCSTADADAQVIEAGGFKGLQPGNNDAVITVQAEDGTKCTYHLTIQRGSAAAVEENESVQTTETTEETAVQETAEEENGESDEISDEASDDASVPVVTSLDGDTEYIPVGGDSIFAPYQVNTTFPEGVLPEGFVEENYEYKGITVQSAYFETGDIRLLYLSTGEGESADFRIYYEDTDSFMDFLQFKGTDGKFIMPVRYEAQIKIPDNYTGSYLPWGDKVIACYIYTELTDNPITYAGDDEEETVDTSEQEPVYVEDLDEDVEFYLIYAMNNLGEENFYLYDYVEGTYQRYVERDTSYELDQSYFKYKDIAHQRFVVMCILIVLLVIACFVIINLITKNRELKAELVDDEDAEDEETEDETEDSGQEEEEPAKGPEAVEEPQSTEPAEETADLKEAETEETETEEAEAEETETEETQTAAEEPEEEIPVRPRKAASFKMINLSREPEPTGLDDDFEFEFINLDDD
jgi:hypothetical protein